MTNLIHRTAKLHDAELSHERKTFRVAVIVDSIGAAATADVLETIAGQLRDRDRLACNQRLTSWAVAATCLIEGPENPEALERYASAAQIPPLPTT